MAQKKIGFTKGSAQADRLILNNGLTATTQISFSGASSLTFSLPQTNGASGQVIVTDGAGNLSFAEAVPGLAGFAFGSAATPSIFFTDDPDTGLFRNGTNQLGFSTGGTQKLLIGTTTIQSDLSFRIANGTLADPSLRFTGTNAGFFRPRTSGGILINNAIAVACGGLTASMFDTASGANETRLLLFDVSANTLVRVSRGPADSGGTGSRALIIPN